MMLGRRSFLGGIVAATGFPPSSFGQTIQRKGAVMRFKMIFDGRAMTATLSENAGTRELFEMLPLDLKIEDYAHNEKIAYLPRKLSQVVDEPFKGERPGDIAYYAPWGNLVFFYDAYRYSKGLIRLGRFDGGHEHLFTRGSFPLRIEAL